MYKIIFILTLVALIPLEKNLGQNIIEVSNNNNLSIVQQVDFYRNIQRYKGTSTDMVRLHCRFYRYSSVKQNMPLLVTFICWNGTIEGSEGVRVYEDAQNDPFVNLVIMPETLNGDPINPDNWYWGNVYTDDSGNKRSVPWIHNGIIELLNDIKYNNLVGNSIFSGMTIDTSRIYGCGTSIGGTATAQICMKHPEIFAAFHSHAGWTKYYGADNIFFSDNRGCLAFSGLIGGKDHQNYCTVDSTVMIAGYADQPQMANNGTLYHAFNYTDLAWYFGQNRQGDWNFQDPGIDLPFGFFTCGSQDDISNQGDNLYGVLESGKHGYMYNRVNDGHSAGGIYIRWNWMRKFRRDQSYLVFTNRNYGLNNEGIGIFNPLVERGWEPSSIIDQESHYYVKLTGTGTSDVTLRRLQNLIHTPGATYSLKVNGAARGTIKADQFGVVTIPDIVNNASIDLTLTSTGIGEFEKVKEKDKPFLFPNPTNGRFEIKYLPNTNCNQVISVFSSTGNLVHQTSNKIIDITNQPDGTYFVKYGDITLKILKQTE
jgi:hypothetical protein